MVTRTGLPSAREKPVSYEQFYFGKRSGDQTADLPFSLALLLSSGACWAFVVEAWCFLHCLFPLHQVPGDFCGRPRCSADRNLLPPALERVGAFTRMRSVALLSRMHAQRGDPSPR
ncbi:hypothetical protein NDU88_003930 [Pleurodeles waltl]|uniref:Uncharacterized protein n=1 Tax=Pleurodeles waltl TaxID=8319 RepID=A0AAV7QAE6_PLEWA|nr:hypothetical protein NDU88_003930 [Pleurodeles waltl]